MTIKKIIEVDYGIASAYEDSIEINRKLHNHPELREKILKHEMRHKEGPYSQEDYDNDFNSKDPYFFKSIKFCLYNPEAFINFFPFMYSYYHKDWTFNRGSLYPVFWLGIIFCVFWWLTLGLNLIVLAISWVAFCAFVNGLILYITHRYVKLVNPGLEYS